MPRQAIELELAFARDALTILEAGDPNLGGAMCGRRFSLPLEGNGRCGGAVQRVCITVGKVKRATARLRHLIALRLAGEALGEDGGARKREKRCAGTQKG